MDSETELAIPGQSKGAWFILNITKKVCLLGSLKIRVPMQVFWCEMLPRWSRRKKMCVHVGWGGRGEVMAVKGF